MPIPGLCDTYEFADWMKVEYHKAGRPVLAVRPEHDGLLTVLFTSKYHGTESVKVKWPSWIVGAEPEQNKALARAIAEAEEMP